MCTCYGIQNITEGSSCSMALDFWIDFAQEMVDSEPDIVQARVALLGSHFSRLSTVLVTSGRHPTTAFGQSSMESFRDIRSSIGQVIECICHPSLVGTDVLLGGCRDALATALQGSAQWQDSEAILHTLIFIGEWISPLEHTHTPAILAMLEHCSTHPRQTTTTLRFLRVLCDRYIPENLQFLELAIQLIFKGLNIRECEIPASSKPTASFPAV